jgi:hypothetical protein
MIYDVNDSEYYFQQVNTKRLLHDISHIDPGISPRLLYGTSADTRDDMENFMS